MGVRQVFAHRAWGHPEAHLKEQFVGDPLLAPRGVVLGHVADECLQLPRYWWAATLGFPAPEQPESLVMPTDQRGWLDNHQGLSPVEASGKPDQRESRGLGRRWGLRWRF